MTRDNETRTVELIVSVPLGIRQTVRFSSYELQFGGGGVKPIDVEECGWCYALVRSESMSLHMTAAGHR